jgi:hypothetical protein
MLLTPDWILYDYYRYSEENFVNILSDSNISVSPDINIPALSSGVSCWNRFCLLPPDQGQVDDGKDGGKDDHHHSHA